jgi:hypothetical protein
VETIVSRFVAELRKAGIRVSPGESLDAVCALSHGGMSGRATVRSLLQMTLVKKVNDIEAFNRTFDAFFKSSTQEHIDDLDMIHEAIKTIEGDSMLGTNPDMVNDDMSLAMVEAGLSQEDVKDLLQLQEVDSDQMDGTEVDIQLKGYKGKLDAPRPSMRMPENPISMAFPQHNAQKSDVTFSQEEIDAMQDAVSRMLLRIKKDIRRVKNKENRGKIHVARTIQKNYRHGMVPFVLSLRRRRKQKPRLVVLCDVSYSVSHASQFMLLLLHTLHNRLMDVRSFVFNAQLAEITEMLTTAPINVMMENIDRGEIIDLDENSNYGQVLLDFKEQVLDNLRGRPAVIFLGDARNNYKKDNAFVLEQIREKSGYMLWLTPEDQENWHRGDCVIEKYSAYCDKVEEVKSIEELNAIVEDLFRNIYLEDIHRSKRIIEHVEDEEGDSGNYYTRGKAKVEPCFDPTARSHW